MAIQIIGSSSGVIADVDAYNQLKVALTQTLNLSGFAASCSQSDPGTIVGTQVVRPLEIDDDFRVRVAEDSIVFFEPWAQTTLNSGTWSSNVSGMTTTVSGSYLRLNGTTTATNSARVTSYRSFAAYRSYEQYIDFSLQVQNVTGPTVVVANTVWEIGLYLASGTATPTDGIYFRMNGTVLQLVSNFNGTEIPTNVPVTLAPNHDYDILLVLGTQRLELWIDNVLCAVQLNNPSQPLYTASTSLPFNIRQYNSGTPSVATNLLIGPVMFSYGGMNDAPEFSDRASLSEQGGYQTQSGAAAPAQTAQWTNLTAATLLTPGTSPLLNTLAGYSTFGGLFSFNSFNGAETDYCLFGFQVPLEAVGAMNRNLVIRGVHISTMAYGTVATAATLFHWGIGVGSNNLTTPANGVSLANTETATSKAPRRIPLGSQAWSNASAVGTPGADVNVVFNSPLLAEPGSFVQIILRIPIGTTTANSSFRGTCFIDAQYE